MRHPLEAGRYLALARSHFLSLTYVEWRRPGSDEHGGCPIADLQGVLNSHPDAQVVYALGLGSDRDLSGLAGEPEVWLVALASLDDPQPANFYDDAVKFGLTTD